MPTWLLPEEVPRVEHLSHDECWELLGRAPFGRLGVRVDGGVDIFPVNFTVKERVIFIRSAPGAKLADMAHASSVAFEIDDRHRRTYWSVVVHGDAHRMSLSTEIEQSGVTELSTLTSSAKWNYVRITPFSISGRRFSTRRAALSP